MNDFGAIRQYIDIYNKNYSIHQSVRKSKINPHYRIMKLYLNVYVYFLIIRKNKKLRGSTQFCLRSKPTTLFLFKKKT